MAEHWRPASELADKAAEQTEIMEKTARNLLSAARRHGLIQAVDVYNGRRRRWVTWYAQPGVAMPVPTRTGRDAAAPA
jgi:hypothetical protein